MKHVLAQKEAGRERLDWAVTAVRHKWAHGVDRVLEVVYGAAAIKQAIVQAERISSVLDHVRGEKRNELQANASEKKRGC